jgi:hypothetical protein
MDTQNTPRMQDPNKNMEGIGGDKDVDLLKK